MINIETVAIPGGTFTMGSARYSDAPEHQVTLSPFHLGKYQVTQAQWRFLATLPKVEINLNPAPSHFKGDTLPVESVNWFECVEACKRLSASTGEDWRLPSEAQWEYACRAGRTDDKKPKKKQGWFYKNSGGTTHGVGQKEPNAWGLYDMHGNVWEWCSDWYGDYPTEAQTDPTGTDSGTYRALRGGSWNNIRVIARAVFRDYFHPAFRVNDAGFRVVLCRPPSS